MTFGEKVRAARKALSLTQQELADKAGVTRRIIIAYESDQRRPRNLENYKKLAGALEIGVNVLLTEDAEAAADGENGGKTSGLLAQELIDRFGAMFAGGELTEAEKDGVMQAIQEIYWDCKEENIRKFSPKKYGKNES